MNEAAQGKASDELMLIGHFATRARRSLKALRLYDAMGLLPPAHTDASSGYRYYHEDQLAQAKLIGLLRQLEMPLERIARVIGQTGTEARKEVACYWRDVEADQAVKRQLVGYLSNYLHGKGEIMHEIRSRDVPEQKVLTLERSVTIKDLPAFIGSASEALHQHLAQSGLGSSGAPFVIFHGEVNEDSDGPVEVCVPFKGSLEPAGNMRVRLEPAHREAYTRLTKAEMAFPGLLTAYDSVHEWLKSNQKAMTAPPREVYFAHWDEVDDQQPACDIAWPYRD